MYFNCCCSCLFKAEIIKIGQSSHKIYSNKILNFQESTTILNACTKKKKARKLIECTTYVDLFSHTLLISTYAMIKKTKNMFKYGKEVIFYLLATKGFNIRISNRTF